MRRLSLLLCIQVCLFWTGTSAITPEEDRDLGYVRGRGAFINALDYDTAEGRYGYEKSSKSNKPGSAPTEVLGANLAESSKSSKSGKPGPANTEVLGTNLAESNKSSKSGKKTKVSGQEGSTGTPTEPTEVLGPNDVAGSKECSVVTDEVTPNLIVSEVNEPGFGNVDNKYSTAMVAFGEYVYVGTLNAPDFPLETLPWYLGEPITSTGAKVYRGKSDLNGTWSWNEVFDFGNTTNIENFGIGEMLLVGDYLYFATVNHEATMGNGVEIWNTKDGLSWSQQSEPGFGDSNSVSGSIAECGGYLYVGVENRASGAQLYRRALQADGAINGDGPWEEVPSAQDGFGNANNYFISELIKDPFVGTSSTDALFAGTTNGVQGMELWKITSCSASDVNSVGSSQVFGGGWPTGPVACPLPTINLPGTGPKELCTTNSGISSLYTATTNIGPNAPAVFVGTKNYHFGASLFVTFDGKSFFPVFLFGNGDDGISSVSSMQVYMGRLYIGTLQRPNLRNYVDLPNSLEGISLVDVTEYVQLISSLGGTNDSPVIPGLTTDRLGLLDLDDVMETAESTVFSFDLNGIVIQNPLVEVVTETTSSFGSCGLVGVCTMTVYQDKLMMGGAVSSSVRGALVFEGTDRSP